MSDKFGWQKAARKDAARRGSQSQTPTIIKHRRRPKRGKKKWRTSTSHTFLTRLLCPNCTLPLTIIGGGPEMGYRCDRCQAKVTDPITTYVQNQALLARPGHARKTYRRAVSPGGTLGCNQRQRTESTKELPATARGTSGVRP